MELNPGELHPDLDDRELSDEEIQELIRRLAADKDFIEMLMKNEREVEAGEKGYSVEETLAAMYAILNGAHPPEISDFKK